MSTDHNLYTTMICECVLYFMTIWIAIRSIPFGNWHKWKHERWIGAAHTHSEKHTNSCGAMCVACDSWNRKMNASTIMATVQIQCRRDYFPLFCIELKYNFLYEAHNLPYLQFIYLHVFRKFLSYETKNEWIGVRNMNIDVKTPMIIMVRYIFIAQIFWKQKKKFSRSIFVLSELSFWVAATIKLPLNSRCAREMHWTTRDIFMLYTMHAWVQCKQTTKLSTYTYTLTHFSFIYIVCIYP